MKQLKLLGVITMILALGMTACGGTKECKTHKWGDKVTLKEATCTEAGQSQRTCTVCGAKEEVKAIPALGHNWKDVEQTVAPGCETKGTMTTKCQRCGADSTREIDALGHEWSTENGTVTPAQGAGYANFYEYPCAHGCGKKSLGFKANEPTEESMEHLVINDNGGARFWGRPIGNDVVLNQNGDPDSDSHDPVFNKEQEGDFFEYKFDLTADQAATLATCRCYCDATPASYMSSNGIDFWANKEGDVDWTRGMYIDDDPAHIDADGKGKEITDYRYVLYVDGQLKQFDGTPAPVTSDDRAEFEMPFTFNLHAGTNTIRLCMAGGYRSVSYNFYFRAVAA